MPIFFLPPRHTFVSPGESQKLPRQGSAPSDSDGAGPGVAARVTLPWREVGVKGPRGPRRARPLYTSHRPLSSGRTGFLPVSGTHRAQPVPTPGPLLLLFLLPRCPCLACSAGESLPAPGSPSRGASSPAPFLFSRVSGSRDSAPS